MNCKHKSFPAAELLAQERVRERIEFEGSPQVVFILECACGTTHSIEFSYDEIPEELANLCYEEDRNVKPGSIVRTFTVLE